MMTVADLAADMKVSEYTAREYLRNGVVPGFQVVPGGPWRVDPEVYAEWKRRRSEGETVVDPNRIPPRSSRSQAARSRAAHRRKAS